MLKIICVTYHQTLELEVLVNSLLLQTSDDWSAWIIHDGAYPPNVKEIVDRYAEYSSLKFTSTLIRSGKWGHPNREYGLKMIEADANDYILITNGDNYYVPGFVEQMLKEANTRSGIGVVYCDTIHSHLEWGYHRSQLFEGGLDMGCFIIRADVAKKVGFGWDHFTADGKYAAECAALCFDMGLSAVHINKGLFIHN